MKNKEMKLCECGCGNPAPISGRTSTELGWIKGRPTRFINKHQNITTTGNLGPNPSGLCMCGCGKPAPIASATRVAKGIVKGQPTLFIHNHSNILKRVPLKERFWKKVNKQGPMPSVEAIRVWPKIAGTKCWEWTGNTLNSGYGQTSINKQPLLAHRAAWFLETGEWPDPFACHKCDNKKCIRFSHLFEGDSEKNMQDKLKKNRQAIPRGEDSVKSTLTWLQVRSIRKEVQMGITTRKGAAKRHGVTEGNVGCIVRGETWKEVA
jgi:hypothetical protein